MLVQYYRNPKQRKSSSWRKDRTETEGICRRSEVQLVSACVECSKAPEQTCPRRVDLLLLESRSALGLNEDFRPCRH